MAPDRGCYLSQISYGSSANIIKHGSAMPSQTYSSSACWQHACRRRGGVSACYRLYMCPFKAYNSRSWQSALGNSGHKDCIILGHPPEPCDLLRRPGSCGTRALTTRWRTHRGPRQPNLMWPAAPRLRRTAAAPTPGLSGPPQGCCSWRAWLACCCRFA